MNHQEIPTIMIKESSSKLFNFRPLFFSAVFLSFGVLCALALVQYDLPWWVLLFALPIAGIPFCFITTKKEFIQRTVAVCAMGLCFLFGLFAFFVQSNGFQTATYYNGEYTVRGRVTEYVVYDAYTRMQLTDVSVDGNTEKCALIAYLPGDFALKIPLSSTVEMVGELTTDTELFDERGFRAYAIDKDVKMYMSADSVTVTGRKFDLFLYCRQGLQTVLETGMDEIPAQTLRGLLFGETSGIDEGLLNNFRYGGIAHVFAVSGLHFGIVFACLSWIFNRECLWRIPKWLRFVFVALLLLFYGGICGFSASVIRAIVTCLTLYGAHLMGVASDWLERISLACLIVLCISPCQLFHAGFLLSFGACYGIALLTMRIEKGLWFCWGKVRKAIGIPIRKYLPNEQTHPLTIPQTIERNSITFLSVTTSAQAFTLPILMTTFGYVSGWSFLLNCIFVPIIGILFPFLLVFVVISALLPLAVASVVLHVPNLIMTIVALVFETFDFTTFALSGIKLSAFAIVCYYFALLLCTDKWNVPRKYTWWLALGAMLCCVTTVCIVNL
ncbi:MAG: ComEC/Rec2 family competence protein [Clostridia bacterium]|nr:ComEC/Rec2 family competence protein [Clostridia bacterium]